MAEDWVIIAIAILGLATAILLNIIFVYIPIHRIENAVIKASSDTENATTKIDNVSETVENLADQIAQIEVKVDSIVDVLEEIALDIKKIIDYYLKCWIYFS